MKKIIALFEVDDDFDYKEYHACLLSENGITHDRVGLNELPQRQSMTDWIKTHSDYDFGVAKEIDGWNSCLDKIENDEVSL